MFVAALLQSTIYRLNTIKLAVCSLQLAVYKLLIKKKQPLHTTDRTTLIIAIALLRFVVLIINSCFYLARFAHYILIDSYRLTIVRF